MRIARENGKAVALHTEEEKQGDHHREEETREGLHSDEGEGDCLRRHEEEEEENCVHTAEKTDEEQGKKNDCRYCRGEKDDPLHREKEEKDQKKSDCLHKRVSRPRQSRIYPGSGVPLRGALRSDLYGVELLLSRRLYWVFASK